MNRQRRRLKTIAWIAMLMMSIHAVSCEQSASPQTVPLPSPSDGTTPVVDEPIPENPPASEISPESAIERTPQVPTAAPLVENPGEELISRYELPDNPGRSMGDPIGHVVALVGTAWSEGRLTEVWIVDPADNITEAGGVHFWSDHATCVPVEPQQDQFVVSLGTQRFEVTHALVVAGRTSDSMSLTSGPMTGMPDFSQHAGPQWIAYCAPAVAADVIYYLSQHDPELIGNATWGPGKDADTAVTQLIAGVDAPPVAPGSLAALMSTSNEAGTSGDSLVKAIDSYLAEHGSKQFNWRTDIVDLTSDSTGSARRDIAQRVQRGAGVILMLFPLPGTGEGSSNVQMDGEGKGNGNGSRGSADEMASGGDSGGESSATTGVAEASGDARMDGQADGGREKLSDESSAGGGMADEVEYADGMWQGGMPSDEEAMSSGPTRVEAAPTPLIAPTLPPAPIELALPRLAVPRVEPREISSTLTLLAGRWRQERTDNRADFAEGGYEQRELRFDPDGLIYVTMKFDDGVTVVRQFRCEIKDNMLVIDTVSPSDDNASNVRTSIVILPTDAKPAVQETPVRLAYEMTDTTLRLADKTYRYVIQE